MFQRTELSKDAIQLCPNDRTTAREFSLNLRTACAKTLVDINENVSKLSFNLFLQSIEVVNDDSNKQVQGEERTDNYEHDEVEIRNKTVLAFRLNVNLKKKRKILY